MVGGVQYWCAVEHWVSLSERNFGKTFFDFRKDQLLGDGTFGSVYRAKYKNQTVAVKVYNTVGDMHPHKMMRQEVQHSASRFCRPWPFENLTHSLQLNIRGIKKIKIQVSKCSSTGLV